TSALMYLDLDQFKIINSCEGHTAGDRLLMDVANKLRQFIDPNDTLVRINSDEYALLIEHTTRDEILRRAETLRRALDEFRFAVHDTTYHISASIGIALIEPGEDMNVRDVLARADQACLMAKKQGRNTIHLYRREDVELLNFKSNVHWVPRIRDALERDRFKLVFQPVLRISDGDIGHYEVLLRMLGDQDELLEPMEFIRVAERMGLIHDIDRWVIRNAVRVLHGLPAEHSHLALNINLSGHAFQDPMLLPLIQEELNRTGVAARRITFEITETATIANFAKTREMVNQIRALGCRFALDDFGAGFNTFNYMKQFPVDYLKIDGAFITNLAGDPVDQALVKSMVDIARTLGKETIAEFVENERNLSLLKELGVDYAQGYYIGRPSPQFG
ncbi:MAG: EAL domain-containing protein, partial [Gammaproteobacteria bacterium]|nr:EAL domain-containing protein [Gammaproteobacteria bacterium]